MTPNPDIAAALQRLDQALESPGTLAKQAITAHYKPAGASEPTIPWVMKGA